MSASFECMGNVVFFAMPKKPILTLSKSTFACIRIQSLLAGFEDADQLVELMALHLGGLPTQSKTNILAAPSIHSMFYTKLLNIDRFDEHSAFLAYEVFTEGGFLDPRYAVTDDARIESDARSFD
jgi:hypothetical protein